MTSAPSDAALRLADELGPLASDDAATAAVVRLRKAGHDPGTVAGAVAQARLRGRATRKFGDLAVSMRLTDAGLQQATRSHIALRHAERYRDAGLMRVADLGCGIGADAMAFARCGLAVRAWEIDPDTAAAAAANLAGIGADAVVTTGAAEDADLAGVDAVWLDPARRTAANGRATRGGRLSPADWSPSLDFAFGLAERLPTGIKLGPGIDRDLIPGGWEAQWVSDGGEVVELAVWSGPLARPGVGRAALVISAGGAHELTAAADAPDVAVGELGEYLIEPDGAVIRARLIGDLARALGARMLHPTIAYLTLDAPPRTPFGAGFRVLEVLPLDPKAIRRALARRGIGVVEIKKRGVDIDPAALRTALRPSGPESATLILTRVGPRRRAILATRV